MTELETFEYIDRYLSGDLSLTEKISFEKKLSLDQSFKKEYNRHQMANLLIETNYANNLSALIKNKQAAAKAVKKKQTAKWSSFVALGLAATFGGYLLFNSQKDQAITPLEIRKDEVLESNKQPSEAPKLALSTQASKENSLEKEKKSSPTPLVEKPQNTPQEQAVAAQALSQKQETEAKPALSKSVAQLDTAVQEVDEIDPKKDKIRGVQVSLPESNQILESDGIKPQNPVVDCEPFSPHIESVNCDLGQSNGELIFKDAGVQFKVGEYGVFDELTEMIGLEKGKYHLSAKTQDGCQYDLGVFEVKEEHCAQAKNYLFNPDLESSLVIPLYPQEITNITIFDSRGEWVLEENLYQADQFKWSGRLSNGSIASIDSYIVLVNKNGIKSCKYDVVVAK